MRVSRVTLALSLVAGLAMTTTAAAATGSISGTVTDEGGLPLEGICVFAGTGVSYQVIRATTAADGTYTISGLNDDSYKVLFRDCRENPVYLTEWYDEQIDFYDADRVAVSLGSAVDEINAALALGGFVTGTVTDDDGKPARTCVAAHTDRDGWLDVTATTYTQDDGSYRLGPLPTGSSQILFADCEVYVPYSRYGYPVGGIVIGIPPESAPQGYVREWFDGHQSYGGDPIPIAPGVATPGIDAVLEMAGGVMGIIADEGGNPLSRMCAVASGDDSYGFGETDENGFYSINKLPAGEHKVVFFDCYGSIYKSEWFDNQPSFLLADPLQVVRKTWTKQIDAALGKRPRPDLAISGLKVSSVPLQALDVTVAGSPWLRTVQVDVSNLGREIPKDEAILLVWARSITDGSGQLIASENAFIEPGTTQRRTYEWNSLGTIGDVTIFASVCTYDDGDRSNDLAQTQSYAGVGGLGVGIRAGLPHWIDGPSCGPGIYARS